MANTVDKVITIAEAEVGYLEKKSNSQLYSKTANAGSANYTKYNKEMHDIYPSVMDFPASWCDAFVDWCFYKAYGTCNAKGLLGGDFNDYTPSSANLYKKKNAWYTSNPKVGDQIFFKNSTRICHTGLVYKVDSTYVYTIEGNTSGASGVIANGGGVCKKKYALNYSSIAGYGRPKYDFTSTPTSTTLSYHAGDIVTFTGTKHYTSADGSTSSTCKPGEAKITAVSKNAKHPYHLVKVSGKGSTVYGWVDADDVIKEDTTTAPLEITSNIKAIQTWLNTYYNTGLATDGIYGNKTKAGLVKAWQKEVGGLEVDGDFGTASKTATSKHTIKKGSNGILVTIWQAYLVCKGYNPNGIDGDFGDGCHKATVSFQKDNGLTQDGIVGTNTWYKAFH